MLFLYHYALLNQHHHKQTYVLINWGSATRIIFLRFVLFKVVFGIILDSPFVELYISESFLSNFFFFYLAFLFFFFYGLKSIKQSP